MSAIIWLALGFVACKILTKTVRKPQKINLVQRAGHIRFAACENRSTIEPVNAWHVDFNKPRELKIVDYDMLAAYRPKT